MQHCKRRIVSYHSIFKRWSCTVRQCIGSTLIKLHHHTMHYFHYVGCCHECCQYLFRRGPHHCGMIRPYKSICKYAHLHQPGLKLLTSSLACTLLSTTLQNYLWLYEVCYYFVLTLKLICRSGWRHHLPLEICFQGRVMPLPTSKNIFSILFWKFI